MKQSSTSIKTLKLYLHQNWQHKWLFLSTNLSWTSGVMLQKLMLPLIVASAFDLIVSSNGRLNWNTFASKIALFLAVALVAQFLIDTGLLLLSKMETTVLARLHEKVYNHLINQSMTFHSNSFSGSLVNQTNRLVTGYVTLTDTFVINISQVFVFCFVSSLVLMHYSPLIGTTLLVWAICFLYINIRLTRKRIRLGRVRAAADTKLTGYLADSMGNIGAIKTFSAEKYELGQYGKLAKDRAKKGFDYWILSIKNDAIFGLLMVTLQILILIVSIIAVQHGNITVGTLVLAQVYMTQTIANLWGLSHIARNVEQTLSDAAEMTEILEQPARVQDVPNAPTMTVDQGAIEFSDVSFTHSDNKEELFDQFNLQIKPGEKVGLVGPSGGGKTTVTKLLLRFMDVQQGSILIDGQDVDKVTQESLRSQIAYVPQEPLLFHRTLAENIGYGNPEASFKEIKKAAKLAHADEFIDQLPKTYETLVGERGVKLSGGQRQRIAIARAMIKDAPILVLDEATSALDSESEVLIQDALWKLMEGRTAIVIAHRLSTVQKMDRIVVMDDGKIVEQGTHHQLLKNKGIYAKLWSHQSGGFLED